MNEAGQARYVLNAKTDEEGLFFVEVYIVL